MLNPLKFFKRCKHKRLRCVHGDEVNQTARMFLRPEIARTACLDCGRYLYDRDMPIMCYFKGKPHWDTHSKERRHAQS